MTPIKPFNFKRDKAQNSAMCHVLHGPFHTPAVGEFLVPTQKTWVKNSILETIYPELKTPFYAYF